MAINHPSLPNVKLTGTLDLVIILGQLLPTNLNNTANLPPVIVWVDQATTPRHIIFIGASQRPVIFVTGKGTGQSTYVAFVGVQSLLGAPLPWRLHWINEYSQLQIIPPLLFGSLQMTGSLRTNWSVLSTDLGTTDRIVIQRDTNPGALTTLMPRDGWFDPLIVQ